MALRTETQIIPVPGQNAGKIHLDLKRSGQIQKGFSGMSRCGSRKTGPWVFLLKKLRNFGTHFEAALADTGANRNKKIGRTAAIKLPHPGDCMHQDARQGSPPAGMDGGDGALYRIRNQNRKAIRNLHRYRNHFNVCNEGIPFGLFPFTGDIFYDICTIGMDLTQGGKLRIREIHGRKEVSPIRVNPFDGIPRAIAEIKRQAGIIMACGKPVTKLRDFFKRFAAVIAHSMGFTENKAILPHVFEY
jgi:hypothetical protein